MTIDFDAFKNPELARTLIESMKEFSVPARMGGRAAGGAAVAATAGGGAGDGVGGTVGGAGTDVNVGVAQAADGAAGTAEDEGAPTNTLHIMEVCGTHTVSIARNGIRSVLPDGIRLISGPGCPVCVTANVDIDRMIALARVPDVIITTFGDMMRVPGSTGSLLDEKAKGADIRIVYSPLDALKIAGDNPSRPVIFVGVGFETTIPLIASSLKRAVATGIQNFSVVCAHKGVPRALDVLVNDPEVQIDAFILPGHVSTIIGAEPYEFLSKKYGIPGVITGFESVDILQGIAMIMRQIAEGRAEVEIAYARGVMREGNRTAVALIDEVFEPVDAVWRGIGLIPGSGYAIREEYAAYDALRRFDVEVEPTVEPKGCRCGDVLRGVITPNGCPLFGRACVPEHPIGPCMVSSEGSCAAFFRYQVKD